MVPLNKIDLPYFFYFTGFFLEFSFLGGKFGGLKD